MTAAPSTSSNAKIPEQPQNPQNIVIVGNGQAGIQLVDSLRKEGYAGTITVIGEETHFPYQRPPLSKDFMAADKEPKPLPLRAEKFFTDNDVDSRLGVRVTAIDRAGHTVELSDGPASATARWSWPPAPPTANSTSWAATWQGSTGCGRWPTPKPSTPAWTRCAPSS